jgi:Uncharacterized protein conserved in bacteria
MLRRFIEQIVSSALATVIALFVAASLLAGCGSTVAARGIETGSQQVSEYLPLLKGKRVCVLSNQTGMVTPKTHVLDTLLSSGVDVVCIMSPEHGFRGDADAGEKVASGVDSKTGIPIRSLYDGDMGRPSAETMQSFDVLVFDLQDVGCRFYTYITTMAKMMESCARYGRKMVILDRPNPWGFKVDGPILDTASLRSGVGYLPIPILHGMTLGEMAGMIDGEHWLPDSLQGTFAAIDEVPTDTLTADFTVIKCKNYTHDSLYRLPVKPSPNLPDMRSIYLYPSLCYFEGTVLSLGRGTDTPFQMYGHPAMEASFTFTPTSRPGAKTPPLQDELCYGVDLRTSPPTDSLLARGIDLRYVIDAYRRLGTDLSGNFVANGASTPFFRHFFDLLTGQAYVREMIEAGASAAEIRARWQSDVEKFAARRRPYLLY